MYDIQKYATSLRSLVHAAAALSGSTMILPQSGVWRLSMEVAVVTTTDLRRWQNARRDACSSQLDHKVSDPKLPLFVDHR